MCLLFSLSPALLSPSQSHSGQERSLLWVTFDSGVLLGSEWSARKCSISLYSFFSVLNLTKGLGTQEKTLYRNDVYPGDRDLLHSDSEPQHVVLSSGEQDTLMKSIAQYTVTNIQCFIMSFLPKWLSKHGLKQNARNQIVKETRRVEKKKKSRGTRDILVKSWSPRGNCQNRTLCSIG